MSVCPKDCRNPEDTLEHGVGTGFPLHPRRGYKDTQDLNHKVVHRPLLALELVDQVLPLLLHGLGKRDVLADGALAKTSQGPHLWYRYHIGTT